MRGLLLCASLLWPLPAQSRPIEIFVLRDGRICLDGGPAVQIADISKSLREVLRAHSQAKVHITVQEQTPGATVRAVRQALR
jgi:biopolymer transport protein ExbD